MREYAIGRIVGLVVALFGFACTLYFARESARLNAEFYQWIEDRPVRAVVDLSQPGEFKFPFRQTCAVSHGEGIYLQVTSTLDANIPADRLLAELTGKVVIRDFSGREILQAEIDGTRAERDGDSAEIRIANFHPFPTGDYEATLQIATGVPTLAGKEQTLYAKYFLCGLEQFPAVIAGGMSFVAGAVGLVVGGMIFPGLWQFGLRRVPTSDVLD